MTRKILAAPKSLSLGPLHAGQVKAFLALREHRFQAMRCGRRFGKTEVAKTRIKEALVHGLECAWFSPQHKTWSEVYSDLASSLSSLIEYKSKAAGVIKLKTGGRLDFWSLENSIAGRGRRYHLVVIDEGAFGKDGDNRTDGSTMEIWEKSIKPTLYDYGGKALVCSNSAGKSFDNFFYNICTDPQYGFKEFHATTMDNPLLPKRLQGESMEDWLIRRELFRADLIKSNHPLVFAQEYQAEFVDWSGVAFFGRDSLLIEGKPVPYPTFCECVFAVIDTAAKTGTDNDATAVTFFALERRTGGYPLVILDWDIIQIEGATLEIWLPSVFQRLEELARQCSARSGALGAFIEDTNSGTILLQQARRKGMLAYPIESRLTALGKIERALNISTYVHQGLVKYSDHAFNKVSVYKQKSRNHLLDQVESFRMDDKDRNREDDLLDTFCYGISIGIGNSDGF